MQKVWLLANFAIYRSFLFEKLFSILGHGMRIDMLRAVIHYPCL